MPTKLELANEELTKAEAANVAGKTEEAAENAAESLRNFIEAGIEPVPPTTSDPNKDNKEKLNKAKDLLNNAFKKTTTKDDIKLIEFSNKHADKGDQEKKRADNAATADAATEIFTLAAREYQIAAEARAAIAAHGKDDGTNARGNAYDGAGEYFAKAAQMYRQAAIFEQGNTDHEKNEKRAAYRAAEQLSERAAEEFQKSADAFERGGYAGSGLDKRDEEKKVAPEKDQAQNDKANADAIK